MYSCFKNILIRTPNFPFNYLWEKNEHLNNKQIQEAIYIASPVLYAELQKLLKGEIKESKEKDRIYYSLYKYISRMTTRCTPFGLFAGCTLGELSDATAIVLEDTIHKHTRLDMFYLCALSQELSKLPEIRNQITYYPNSSLYPSGKKYRYVEYQYVNSKRTHQISAVEQSTYLNAILKKAANGINVNELLKYLVQDEIPEKEAMDFIHELIDSQIIVGEISPSVTGGDYLSRMIEILDNIENREIRGVEEIKEVKELIDKLCFGKEDPFELYKHIIEKIEKIKISYEERFIFQVDMTKDASVATIGKEIIDELCSTMLFLNKITIPRKNETLMKFQQAFYERYEEREVPLMEVLDPELGIGYPINANDGNISPLLDNFFLPKQMSQRNYQTDTFQSILFSKIQKSLSEKQTEIVFTDEDIKSFKENWDDLPPTIYCLFEIIRANQENVLIKLNSLGGSCGANLLARFAHTSEGIVHFIKTITTKEKELMPDVVLAEIAHLPDSRIGNILSRPHIRDYEILYLANSDLHEENLIYLSDLTLSIRQGRICLYSKKLNKEIVPRLTTAHNYHNSPMPVYHFLCDMQIQSGRDGLFFNWGYLGENLTFRPRVRYKNTILSLATWKIKIEEIKHLFSIKEDSHLISETNKWRTDYSLPQYVLLPDGDNELFINWEDVLSIRALFSVIKKRQEIIFTEFLFEIENGVVKDKDEKPYLNECIVVFHNNEK